MANKTKGVATLGEATKEKEANSMMSRNWLSKEAGTKMNMSKLLTIRSFRLRSVIDTSIPAIMQRKLSGQGILLALINKSQFIPTSQKRLYSRTRSEC